MRKYLKINQRDYAEYVKTPNSKANNGQFN